MEPPAARMRRAVIVTVAMLAAVFGALALLFGAVLEPGKDLEGCSTGLYPGAYADAIIPAHLAGFGALALLIAWLSAQRGASGRPGRGTIVALSAIAVFVLAATVCHELMDWPALLGLIVVLPLGALTAVAVGVNTVLVLRSRQPPERGWERHARLAHVAAWLALLIGLPAMLAGAWTNGAGLFCF